VCNTTGEAMSAAASLPPSSAPRQEGRAQWPKPRVPRRYRRLPCGPAELAAYNAARDEVLARARVIDAAQQALARKMAEVRTDLAAIRLVMSPQVDEQDIVQGFRQTRVKGPAPIPPVAANAYPVHGRYL